MNYYRLKAELMSSLMIQENRQSNAPRGLPYLPGSSLRGAVAGHYLRTGGSSQDKEFQELFLSDPVAFPNLLPVRDPACIPRPSPATACSCKRSPGFHSQEGHGVGDSLAAMVAAEMEGRPLIEALICKTCGEDLKPFVGVWNSNEKAPNTMDPVLVYHRHTGIDRCTGTVASSIFYITQGISEYTKDTEGGFHPQHLSGGLFLSPKQAEILANMIDEPVFAGADRTRGMGEILLSLEPAEPPGFDLTGWDEEFRKKVDRFTQRGLPEGIFFTIGLEAHTILVDRFLRPSCEIDVGFVDVKLYKRVVQHRLVRGWQSSWQLPKPEDMAVASGGVYLFLYEGENPEGLKSRLYQLVQEGIGLRRPEGFGSVNVCDSLHLQEVI
jgi:CRISPR-associated protein Csx10